MTEDDINKAETLIGFLEYYVKKPWIDGMREIVVGSIEEYKEWVEKAKLTRQPTGLVPLNHSMLSNLLLKIFPSHEKVDSITTDYAAKEIIKRFGQPSVVLPKRLEHSKGCITRNAIDVVCNCGAKNYNDAITDTERLNPQINFGGE